MKRIKELLLFMLLLLVLPILLLVIRGFLVDLMQGSANFVALSNYIRMFMNDKIFGQMLVNTVMFPTLVSFCFVAVFALIVCIVRKKIQVPRWLFYLGSVFVGGMTSLIYIACVSALTFRVPSHVVATLQPLFGTYQPSVFDALTITNVLISLYIGILTAFIFWILELIIGIVKKARRKRDA